MRYSLATSPSSACPTKSLSACASRAMCRRPSLCTGEARYWSDSTAAPGRRSRRPSVMPRHRRSHAPDREFGYQVVLEPQGKRWLLALETPVRWSIPRAALSPGLQLLSAEPFWERVSYRARSVATGVGATEASEQSLAAEPAIARGAQSPHDRTGARTAPRVSGRPGIPGARVAACSGTRSSTTR